MMHTLPPKQHIPKRPLLNKRLRQTRFSPEEVYIIIQLWGTRFYRKQNRYKIYFAPNPLLMPDYEYYDYWLGHPKEGASVVDGDAVMRLVALGVLINEMSDEEYEIQCVLGLDPQRYFILSAKWCRYGLVKITKYDGARLR